LTAAREGTLTGHKTWAVHRRHAIVSEHDIAEGIARVARFREDKAAFGKDLRTQDAILRNLQVMGEAAKKVSVRTREDHPGVPWKDIAGMRDPRGPRLFRRLLDIAWDVVENHLPPLRESHKIVPKPRS
jgi:uncharacterized protein with HEPN domain